jgi:FMN reductase
VARRRLVVIAAGLSQPSSTRLLADRLAAASADRLRRRGDEVEVEVVELRELAQDLTNNLLTGFPSPHLKGVMDTVLSADALIAVSPIFNASYSGLFKTFFDVLERDSLAGMPVVIAATGGTPRHSLALEHALRPLFAYLNAATVPTAVFAASEDWGRPGMPAHADLSERIERAAGELAAAVVSAGPRPSTDRFADPPAFDDLLREVRNPGSG